MSGVGVKGSDVYSTTGDPRLDLNMRLVRGAAVEDLQAGLDAVLAAGHMTDAFVMTVHARNVRGGKGERDVASALFERLWRARPEEARRVLALWPEYGSWRDLFEMACESAAPASFREAVLDLAVAQLQRDAATPSGVGISLCAKWAPRERSGAVDKCGPLLRPLAARLFPASTAQLRDYRQLVAGLNRRLETMETHMCAGEWAEIRPDRVPGRAGKLYGRALLNLVSTKGPTDREGLRHPESADRMACRERFQAHFAAAAAGRTKIHGAATVFPHEIVRKAWNLPKEAEERTQISALWRATVEAVAAGGGLGRTVMMSDFSGSMQCAGSVRDLPYWVSMALGILGAQVCSGPFRGRLMTFDSTPTWHSLPSDDLFACMETIRDSGVGQGTSTNFEAAMQLVLRTLREGGVPAGQEPTCLLVLTDMGWDQAAERSGRAWETHVERLRAEFAAGGWQMPQIAIWNLAAQYASDHHARADVPGVAMLSGWSAAQFRILQQEGVRELTPLEVLRVELDDPRYDPVRAAVAAPLAGDDAWTPCN